jgi:hypothetical protein
MDWRGTMKGVRGSRNKTYTRWTPIDTMLDCMLHAGLRICLLVSMFIYLFFWSVVGAQSVFVLLACTHQCIAYGARLFAGELHVNYAVFIVRASEHVVGKHMRASNKFVAIEVEGPKKCSLYTRGGSSEESVSFVHSWKCCERSLN